jgi:hypothetical protein
MPRIAVRTIRVLVPALLLCSCGIESYYYLPPVPSGNITTSMNEQAVIRLPNFNIAYFSSFTMYYRIYTSYSNDVGFSLSRENLQRINSTLYSDYSYIEPYTSSTNSASANASIMTNRGYQPLFFESASGGDISSDILTDPGSELRIAFPQPSPSYPYPYLNYSGRTWYLKRSNGGGSFSPVPADRYFLNTSALNDHNNLTATINADVVNVSGSSSGTRHAYVAVYIITSGLNEQAYTPIFSIPTFVGIFLLPNM